jgi:hypothetical protein
MKLADGIRKHGFRRWYERELLQSHAHLVVTFLCVIGVFAAFEGSLRFRGWSDQFGNIAAILVLSGAGIWAMRRYLYLLTHAEAVAHQADCPACGTYGRLQLVRPDESGDSVPVCCRKCQYQWCIEA